MKKINYSTASNIIVQNNCILLSEPESFDINKLKIKCKCNSIFSKSFQNFKRSPQCKTCSINILSEKHKKITIDDVNNYVIEYGYKCVSDEYIHKNIKLKFICNKNHQFDMLFHNFKQGRRCPICIGVKKLNIEYIKESILKFDYKCLTNTYKNNKQLLDIICPKGHLFKMSWNNFNSGCRCLKCYRDENYGDNHQSYNPNREEISINKRLRKSFTRSWIIKNMKNDIRYKLFLESPENYVIDHIYPIHAFSKYILTNDNIPEKDVKKIANDIDNLQLLTIQENVKKYSTYNPEEFLEWFHEKLKNI